MSLEYSLPDVSKLVFIIAVLVVGWLLYKLYFRQLIAEGKVGKIKIALVVFGLIFMLMAITGRAHGIFAVIGAAMTQIMRVLPLLIRFFPQIRQMLDGQSPFSGDSKSTIRSQTIIMTVQLSNGSMEGQVVAGEFSGRNLRDLSAEETATLLQWCQQHDKEAARLLLAYLARTGGRGYKDEGQTPPQGESCMSRTEALEILGLADGATRKDVVEAHRRLMNRMHPDKGGSNYLAAKINTAKKTLLNSKRA